MTKPILKKWWLWLTIFLVFVLILGALSSEPEPIVAAQVKEIKPPPTASFPKQKYLEETFVADGKIKTFALQNSYKDVTVSLNGEVQVLGVKQEKNIDVVFLDVTPDAQATSKKIQFAEVPPPQSVVTVTGAVFNTQAPKPTETPTPIPKSTQVPTSIPTQQTTTWQRIHYWEGSGEKELETITIGNRKLALKRLWTNGPEPIYDDPDDVSPAQSYGIYQCEMNQQYEECTLINHSFIGESDGFTYYIQEIPSEILVRDRPMLLKVSAEKKTNWSVEILELK